MIIKNTSSREDIMLSMCQRTHRIKTSPNLSYQIIRSIYPLSQTNTGTGNLNQAVPT